MKLHTYIDLDNSLRHLHKSLLSKYEIFEFFPLNKTNLNSVRLYFHDNGYDLVVNPGSEEEFEKLYYILRKLNVGLRTIAETYHRFLINYLHTNILTLIIKNKNNTFPFILKLALLLYRPQSRKKLLEAKSNDQFQSILELIDNNKVIHNLNPASYCYLKLFVRDRIFFNPEDNSEIPALLWEINWVTDPFVEFNELFQSNKMEIDDESDIRVTKYCFDKYLITNNPDIAFFKQVVLYPSLFELKYLYGFEEIKLSIGKVWKKECIKAFQIWKSGYVWNFE